MDLVEADADEVIFQIGQNGDLFYFVIDGIVEIRVPDFQNMQDYNDLQH